MNTARRIAWWSLLALVFLVPVALSNFTLLGFEYAYTADQFDLVKVVVARVLSLLALAAWAWDLLRRGGKVRRNPVDWVILAFLAWVALTTITSIHWPTALFGKKGRYEGLLSFMDYALIYFLVLQFADCPSRLFTLARAVFWSSVIVAGYGVLQSAGWDPIELGRRCRGRQRRAFSTYGNPDPPRRLSSCFRSPIALGLALVEHRLLWRLVYWAGFGRQRHGAHRGVHARRLDRELRGALARRCRRLAPARAGCASSTGSPPASAAAARRRHHLAQPVQHQRGHELRQALRLDLSVGQR